MKRLYVIAGCNGAGKTTASYTLLPEVLDCDEFVNADEIAKGLSPFKPETAGIQAGRLMLSRINFLLECGSNFAFETTLSTKSYKNLVERAQYKEYKVTLLFFYLSSENLAIERVKYRVAEGGHDIPIPVIRRRYKNGLSNFFKIYKDLVDEWTFIETTGYIFIEIAHKKRDKERVFKTELWEHLKKQYHDN